MNTTANLINKASNKGRHGDFACECCWHDTPKKVRRAVKRRERQSFKREVRQLVG